VLHAEDDTLAFLRDAKNEKLVVVAHRGPSMGPSEAVRVATGGIADGTELRELFSSASVRVEQGHMRVPAMPAGIAIWRVRK
jgi:hypothetical protein